MSFADKVKSFFHRSSDKVKEAASDVDTSTVKEKATEVVDKAKDKVNGDK